MTAPDPLFAPVAESLAREDPPSPNGGSLEDLFPGLPPSPDVDGNRDQPQDHDDRQEPGSNLTPMDLAEVVAGNYQPPTPDLVTFHDEPGALLYAGLVNGIHGASGHGKSWLALLGIAQTIQGGQTAAIIDYESNPAEIVARLRGLGLTDEQLIHGLLYVRVEEPIGVADVTTFTEIAAGAGLVVIDSVGEALAMGGRDENNDADVAVWTRAVPRRIADAGPAVLLVDHGTKAEDNVLFASGSKRKRAAITGASYYVKAITAPTRKSPGRLRLTCAKDRHGSYAIGEHVGDATIQPTNEGATVGMRLWRATEESRGELVVLELIGRQIIDYLDQEDRPVSENELLGAVTDQTKGRTRSAVLGARDKLEAEGLIEVQRGGPGRPKTHTLAPGVGGPK